MKHIFSIACLAFSINASAALPPSLLQKGVKACTWYTKDLLIGEASYQHGTGCKVVSLKYGNPRDSLAFDYADKKNLGAVRVTGELTLTCGSRSAVYRFEQITSYEGNKYGCNVKPVSPFGY